MTFVRLIKVYLHTVNGKRVNRRDLFFCRAAKNMVKILRTGLEMQRGWKDPWPEDESYALSFSFAPNPNQFG